MNGLKTFRVQAAIPKRLEALKKIGHNIWWTWSPKAIDLFRSIDLDLWTKTYHNPIATLGYLSKERFLELESSETFCSNIDLVEVELDWYLYQPKWFDKVHKKAYENLRIAYFSAEYGLHESIPLYSGGLGILSGDHLKSADELGIPLVGIGLAYKQGYFKQILNADGWQQEVYPKNDFHNMSINITKQNGKPVIIDIDLPGRKLYAKVWDITIGRNTLFLLDTNIEPNSYEDRQITAQLYGGDKVMRIKQEILLGIGGVRALDVLGIKPTVFHMNEGHSAFLIIERIRKLVAEENLTFYEAMEVVAPSSVFTTHTPVAAGLDKFSFKLIDEYLSIYYDKLKISREEFIALGELDNEHMFCMANFAISFANTINGVSKLHKEVSKDIWNTRWKSVPSHEIPITSVTNGVHTRTWLSDEMTRLFERYLGPLWFEDPVNTEIWDRIDIIPLTELWRSQVRLKERLVGFARRQLRESLQRLGAPQFKVKEAEELLDPEALTICFARRFATYKRANLIFRDIKRLSRILNNKDKPVQLIFAGKAHPKDNEGKEYIKQINHILREEEFRTKIAFIEDYDINIARYMVQGADIWLNNPRRPLEASGTSGMKTAVNGGLNLSVLDGWWCEGYNLHNGWTIGGGEVYDDLEYQDEVESNALYDILEQEIVPLYYKRGVDRLPREWIEKMKESIKTISPAFNSNRMLKEYTEKLYFKAHNNYTLFTKDNFANAKSISKWKEKLLKEWDNITVKDIEFIENKTFEIGNSIEIKASVYLGEFKPSDVNVQIYYGKIDPKGELPEAQLAVMQHEKEATNGHYTYHGEIVCEHAGHNGFTLRVIPKNKYLIDTFNLGLIYWT